MLLENVNSSLDAEETVSGHWSGKAVISGTAWNPKC